MVFEQSWSSSLGISAETLVAVFCQKLERLEWLKLLNLTERSFAGMEIPFLKTEIADICKFSSGGRQLIVAMGFLYPLVRINEVCKDYLLLWF